MTELNAERTGAFLPALLLYGAGRFLGLLVFRWLLCLVRRQYHCLWRHRHEKKKLKKSHFSLDYSVLLWYIKITKKK